MNKSYKNISIIIPYSSSSIININFNWNKLLITLMLLMTIIPIISIFLSNFIHLWILMEINTMILISTMSIFMKKFKSTMNFFIIQSFSSLMLIFLLMYKNNFIYEASNLFINMILMLTFSLKMGLFPFHYWPPMINKNIDWILILFMSTSQKLIPLLLINMYMNQIINNQLMFMMLMISILSSIMSTIMNINEMNLKKILTFSSTNHLSWMIMIIMYDSSMFILYFIVYTISMLFLCFIFSKLNINSILSLNKIQLFNFKNINLIITMNLLIISALPPFLTFIMKINILKNLIENNTLMSSFILMMMSIFTLIFYMNIVIKINMLDLIKMKFYKFNLFNMKFNFMSTMLISLMTLTFLFPIFYFFMY
uniref:NADH-ubiquinone oxidoreductase chain 2 n=1 Tax=Vespa basalis TaxID=7444 RepID=A0A6B9QN21_VESBA|nr:NADH dehydrogenase subunit 2 [Vespa basalis]